MSSMNNPPSIQELSNAAKQALNNGMHVSEVQLPNGTRVKKPDLSDLLAAQQQLAQQAAAASGAQECLIEEVQVGRLEN